MNKKIIFIVVLSFLPFMNCSTDEPYKPVIETGQNGTINFNVTWPSAKHVAKSADIKSISSITAYVNSEAGTEITHVDLRHEDSRGKAEISVASGSNYQVVLVAFENDSIKYIGSDNDVDVTAGGTTTADVTMVNAAPTLNSAESSGSNAYSFSWSSSPFATNYIFQQDDNDSFSSPSESYGSILKKSFTDVASGKYYHRVCSITKYGTTIWSEIKFVEVGGNGSISIDIPWPEETHSDYFTIGSTMEEVRAVQGTPSSINTYESINEIEWKYSYSTVTFSFDQKVVIGYDNSTLGVDLKVFMGTKVAGATFSLGSTQQEVLNAQGTPTGVQVWDYVDEIEWKYKYSTVTFTLSSKTVKEYDESTLGDKLNVK